jgi:hypothetical protein
MNPDIRWKQRFQNFDHAFVLLREALERGPEDLSMLEKEGVIQRFEYTFELAWKTSKTTSKKAVWSFLRSRLVRSSRKPLPPK